MQTRLIAWTLLAAASCKSEAPAPDTAARSETSAPEPETPPEPAPAPESPLDPEPPPGFEPTGDEHAPKSLESKPASPEIVARARAIQKDLECLRGRPFKEEVGVEFQSLDDFGAYLDKQIAREFGGEKGQQGERLLHALRIVDPKVDITEMMRKSAIEQAAAYYDPDTNTFYVVQNMPDMVLDMVMAHELQHAQQDQYHRMLDDYIDGKFETLDAELAARFLVEGEATLVGNAWMVMNMGRDVLGGLLGEQVCYLPGKEAGSPEQFWPPVADMLATQAAQTREDVQDPGIFGKLATRMLSESMYDSMRNLRDLPNFFFYSLLLPYNVGAVTVFKPFEAGGYQWRPVDALYTRPPQTTEQALHPEKLTGQREAFSKPKLPTVGDAPFRDAEGWTADPPNRVGELAIRILLIEHGYSESEAADAAAGWRGDAVRVFQKGDMLAYDWQQEWDGNSEATQFRIRVPAVLKSQHPNVNFEGGTASAENPKLPEGSVDFSWEDENGKTRSGRLQWRARDVYLVDGFDWPLKG